MRRDEFVNRLAEFCEFDTAGLTPETPFKSIKGYDSLAVMTMIAFIDENFGVKLTAQQLKDLTDFNSLITLVGDDKIEK